MLIIKNIVYFVNAKIMGNNALSLLIMKALPSFKTIFGAEYRDVINSPFQVKPNINELLKVVNIALSNVPYYKKNKVKSIVSLHSFQNVLKPFNKDILLNNFNELKSSEFDKNDYDVVTTGGTSGKPAKFYLPKTRYKREYGFYHKVWGHLDYNEDLRAVIRNERLTENKIYKINPITKEVIFDGFRNNESYYDEIYKKVIESNIIYFQGYPSSIYNFFLHIQKTKKDISFVKGVFLSSEIFLDHQRRLLIETLKLPVISVYGHSEKLIMAVDFNGNNQYQVIEDYGYLELLDENGNVIKEEGVLGEIVGTTLNNLGMPLLRYKTGDYSSYIQYAEGKPRILNGIQGRWQEMKIYNMDGSFVTPTALNLHNDLYNYIDGLQYFQKEKGKLEVRIIPNPYFNEKIKARLYNHFKKRMQPNTIIDIMLVSELKKKKNGKFLLLETTINN